MSTAPEVRFETSAEKRFSTSYSGWFWVSANVSFRVWAGVSAHPVRPTNGIATDAAAPVAPIFRSLRRAIMVPFLPDIFVLQSDFADASSTGLGRCLPSRCHPYGYDGLSLNQASAKRTIFAMD